MTEKTLPRFYSFSDCILFIQKNVIAGLPPRLACGRMGLSAVYSDSDLGLEPHGGRVVVSLRKALFIYFPCLVADLWQKFIVPAAPATSKRF